MPRIKKEEENEIKRILEEENKYMKKEIARVYEKYNYETKSDGTIVKINQDNDSENKGIFYTSLNKLIISLFILSIFL